MEARGIENVASAVKLAGKIVAMIDTQLKGSGELDVIDIITSCGLETIGTLIAIDDIASELADLSKEELQELSVICLPVIIGIIKAVYAK
jgi:hypothetical protein